MPWRQKARHGPGHARTRRDRIRRQEPLQPRTSTEQLTESGKGNDQDHGSGATQLQAGCAGSGSADEVQDQDLTSVQDQDPTMLSPVKARVLQQLERLIIAAQNILEAGGAQVSDSDPGAHPIQLLRRRPREQHHHLSPCKNGSKSRVGDMFRVLANVMFERVILRDFHRVARFG